MTKNRPLKLVILCLFAILGTSSNAQNCDTLDQQWLTPSPTASFYGFGGGWISGVPDPLNLIAFADPKGIFERFTTPSPGVTPVGAVRVGLGLLRDDDDDMRFDIVVYDDDGFGLPGTALGGLGSISPTAVGFPGAGMYAEAWFLLPPGLIPTTNDFHVGVIIRAGDINDTLAVLSSCLGPTTCPVAQGESDGSNHIFTSGFGFENLLSTYGADFDINIVPRFGYNIDGTFNYSSNTFCKNEPNPSPTITGVSGGSFSSSSPNLIVNPSSGQINLSSSTAGNYIVSYTPLNSCSSANTFSITLNNTSAGIDNQTACDSFPWIDGNIYTSSTTTTFNIPNGAATGCDSLVTLNLTINNSDSTFAAATTCDPLNTGVASVTNPNQFSCDSVHTVTTTLLPPSFATVIVNECDSAFILGSWLYTSITFNDTISLGSINNCDSITTFVITITSSSAPTLIATTTCSPSQVGSISDTLMNAAGCDSLVVTNTSLLPTSNATQSLTSCDSIQIGSSWYFNSTIFNDTILGAAANGCDSVTTYNILINNSIVTSDTITECDSAFINNTWYYTSQTINIAGTTLLNCDSTHVTVLTVNQSSSSTDLQSSCTPITWIDGNTYSSSNNTATASTLNALGCDSIITLDLTILPSITSVDTQSSCGPFTWIDGNIYNTSNSSATFTLPGANSCDSLVILDLTVNQPSSNTDTIVACDSLTWINGVTYYSSTSSPAVTLTNSVGCDSIINLDLSIFFNNIVPDVQAACDSFTWIDGNTYTASTNTPTFTLTNGLGCDSIALLNLTINNSSYSTDNLSACTSITWIDGNTYSTANNTATYNVPGGNVNGCDSVVTLNFTIIPSTSSVDTIVSCGSYTWINGLTYNGSNNTANITLTDANGCDSLVTLNLTVNNPSSSIDVVNACGSYQWIDGNIYTASNNTATTTINNSSGCDSIITLDLTINSLAFGVDSHTACDQFTWIDGNTYTGSNNTASFTYSGGAANGCDSTVFLNLTIFSSQGITYVLTQECDSYTWVNGVTYTSSVINESYVIPGASPNGCDSLFFLDLTIVSSGSGTDVITACESYTWIDGLTYTSDNNTATYTVQGGNSNGCDIMRTLDLSIIPIPIINISNFNGVLTATSGLSNYQWYRNGASIPGANSSSYAPINYGQYTCTTDNGLCQGLSNPILIFLTGISDLNFDYISIYPNPVNDFMHLDIGNEQIESIRLIDITGQQIANLDANSRKFYMGDYAQGMYFIELANQDKRSIVKIILK